MPSPAAGSIEQKAPCASHPVGYWEVNMLLIILIIIAVLLFTGGGFGYRRRSRRGL